jgi:hypothetical protein
MPRTIVYVVQFFTLAGERLTGEPPLSFTSPEEAEAAWSRVSPTKAGGVVASMVGDPWTGEWDEAELMFRSGRLPPGMIEGE